MPILYWVGRGDILYTSSTKLMPLCSSTCSYENRIHRPTLNMMRRSESGSMHFPWPPQGMNSITNSTRSLSYSQLFSKVASYASRLWFMRYSSCLRHFYNPNIIGLNNFPRREIWIEHITVYVTVYGMQIPPIGREQASNWGSYIPPRRNFQVISRIVQQALQHDSAARAR